MSIYGRLALADVQMVELEETFITQLQRVADTYKREMQEQHSMRSDLEVRLRAAQLAAHQADTRNEDAQAALHTLQVPCPLPQPLALVTSMP